MTARRRLTGRLSVAIPPDEAFRLFTARGEQQWVPGWRPHFPAPVDDDTAPGTVFQTDLHGRATTWTVVDSVPGRGIRYARVTAGLDAGTVTVALNAAGNGSEVTVTYDLTALTEAGAAHLETFAASYPAFLRSWQDAITHRDDTPEPG